MRLYRLLLLAALVLVPGCGLFSNNGDFGEPDYASEASTNLKRGDEALDSSQYQLAEKYFEYVKTKFPFLEASRQAELRLADVSFERAKKKQADIRERLVRHEVYVADFYEKRDRWVAAVNRLETVLQKYPGPDDDKYLFRLHDLYSRLKDQTKARDALQRVITRLPGTPAAERAQKMLGS